MEQLAFSDLWFSATQLNDLDIRNLIPHRPPILMLDDAEVSWDNSKISASCKLTKRQYLFAGHFPGYPILPGIYILEAMAQAGALLCFFANPSISGKNFVFAGAESVKWRRPALPSMVLNLEVEIAHLKRSGLTQAIKLLGKAFCGTNLMAQAKFMGMLG